MAADLLYGVSEIFVHYVFVSHSIAYLDNKTNRTVVILQELYLVDLGSMTDLHNKDVNIWRQ